MYETNRDEKCFSRCGIGIVPEGETSGKWVERSQKRMYNETGKRASSQVTKSIMMIDRSYISLLMLFTLLFFLAGNVAVSPQPHRFSSV